ncbi:MAG TPA: CBS domain-containing protein [Pseudonocardiaceae bacterium]|nr:CBS domain-containing protein [Pseudonocardiaceae bacterium]
MKISDVLRGKGHDVATVGRTDTVDQLVATLGERNIGAAVVAERGAVVGIVSERDVVRRLRERGADLLSATVAEIMTADVYTCSPEDTVDHLAEVMTERRIRHVPVLRDGALVGIVSIGDVVKSRISQLVSDREQLESYIVRG